MLHKKCSWPRYCGPERSSCPVCALRSHTRKWLWCAPSLQGERSFLQSKCSSPASATEHPGAEVHGAESRSTDTEADKDTMVEEGAEGTVVPGLPDDIAMMCLARLPRLEHPSLSAVCKSWRALFKSQELLNVRTRLKSMDPWLLVLCEDSRMDDKYDDVVSFFAFDLKSRKRWSLPTSHELVQRLQFGGYKCTAMAHKFFVIGGALRDDVGLHGLRTVDIFDTLANRWAHGASMIVARSYFASGVIDGRLYVAGGYNTAGEVEVSGEVYDMKTDDWSPITPMPYGLANIESDAVFQGRLFIKGRSLTGGDDERKVLAYDPAANSWEEMEQLESSLLDGEFVATDQELYVMNRSNYIGKYIEEASQWQQVGTISLYFFPFDCKRKRGIGFGYEVFFLNNLEGESMDLYECDVVNQVLPKVFWQWQGAIIQA